MIRVLWLVAALLAVLGGVAPGSAERLVLVAGGGKGGDGSPAREAELAGPFGTAFDAEGNLYFVEINGNRLRKVDTSGTLTTLAGTGARADGGDGGPAAGARLNGPHGLALAPNGDLYIADTWNNRVRRINLRSGIITSVAGTGEKGFSGDGGAGTAARFGGIYGVALDSAARRLYMADLDNRRVRVLDLSSGIVTTLAGNGQRGVPQDGADAATSPLWDPRAVAVDSRGNVYILERGGHALRVVDPSGKIRTVVGTGKPGATGDGGDARQATLRGPKHLCVDAQDNVIIADTDNHVIRKYLPREGKIVRVAGAGRVGAAGLGAAPDQVELNQPHGVWFDRSGVLYICDSLNNRILRLER